MANKKQNEVIENVKKKSTSTNKKKNSTKTNSTKKVTTKSSTKKTNNQVSTKKVVKKTQTIKPEEKVEVKNVELANVIEKDDKRIENNKNLKKASLKERKKENKKLLIIGIFMVILGIISLLTCLVANRIVDREFLSDNAITFMIVASIIIEGFGSFIIINES